MNRTQRVKGSVGKSCAFMHDLQSAIGIITDDDLLAGQGLEGLRFLPQARSQKTEVRNPTMLSRLNRA